MEGRGEEQRGRWVGGQRGRKDLEEREKQVDEEDENAGKGGGARAVGKEEVKYSGKKQSSV